MPHNNSNKTVEDLFNGDISEDDSDFVTETQQNKTQTTRSMLSDGGKFQKTTFTLNNSNSTDLQTQATLKNQYFEQSSTQEYFYSPLKHLQQLDQYKTQTFSFTTKPEQSVATQQQTIQPYLQQFEQSVVTQQQTTQPHLQQSEQSVTTQQQTTQENSSNKPIKRKSVDKTIGILHKKQKTNYYNFSFPEYTQHMHEVIFSYTPKDLQKTVEFLGPDLSTGYTQSQELNDFSEKTSKIITHEHCCGKFSPSTYIFVSDEVINNNQTNFEEKDFDYIIAAFKSKRRNFCFDRDIYVFNTLREKLPDTKKIIIVTSQLLNSKGYLRDINIGYDFIVKFYEKIEKCDYHYNCYKVHALKEKNTTYQIQISRGKREKYKVKNYNSQSEYAKVMMDLMKKRAVQAIKLTKEKVENSVDSENSTDSD